MKVLVINRQYYIGGGAEAAVRGLVEMLKAQRHEVRVLTLESPDICDDAMVRTMPSFSNNFSHSRILKFLVEIIDIITPWKIYRFIRKEKFDRIHAHNLRGMGMFAPLSIRLAAKLGNSVWTHTLHDIQLVIPSGVKMYSPEGITSSFAEKLYSALQCLTWGSPRAVIAPSRWLWDFYRERGFFKRSEFKYIPNVIQYPNAGGRLIAPQQNEMKSILFVGVLEGSKGIKQLIDAYLELHTDVPLEIVGNGSLLKTLKESYGSGQIIFHGGKGSDELAEFYRRALITVVPSLTYENAPTVIAESFHYGVPVIASRIGGIPEMVEEGTTGWLVEPRSVQELSASLHEAIKIGISEAMRRNCQRRSIEFSAAAYNGHTALFGA